MTAIAFRRASLARPALLAVGLTSIVLVRWSAAAGSIGDPILVGLAFGGGLVALALASGMRAEWPRARSIPVGIGGGAVLVVIALLAERGVAAPPASASFPFVPWAVATVLVATGEEAILRGSLFDAIEMPFGTTAAIVVTSACFALIHVPLYGWHVVPLDFGVGLWLAGLRLLSGGIAAPAIAHSMADLATFWL